LALSGSGNTKTAGCSTTSLAAGTHSLVATYSGDAGNAGSTSTALSQVINGGGKANTTTTISSSQNPSKFGRRVTFTARVTGNAPTGTIAFTDGGNAISGCIAVQLAGRKSGAPRCTTSKLAIGPHSITATYSGDAANNGSNATLQQLVNR
jgi:hypothetical protein